MNVNSTEFSPKAFELYKKACNERALFAQQVTNLKSQNEKLVRALEDCIHVLGFTPAVCKPMWECHDRAKALLDKVKPLYLVR